VNQTFWLAIREISVDISYRAVEVSNAGLPDRDAFSIGADGSDFSGFFAQETAGRFSMSMKTNIIGWRSIPATA